MWLLRPGRSVSGPKPSSGIKNLCASRLFCYNTPASTSQLYCGHKILLFLEVNTTKCNTKQFSCSCPDYFLLGMTGDQSPSGERERNTLVHVLKTSTCFHTFPWSLEDWFSIIGPKMCGSTVNTHSWQSKFLLPSPSPISFPFSPTSPSTLGTRQP